MKNKHSRSGGANATISLRLTPEERRILTQSAAGGSLSSHIRRKLFAEDGRVSESANGVDRVSPLTRQRQIAQILAELGKSQVAASLHAIAEAARIGALEITAETQLEIRAACTMIREMRGALLRALGLRPGQEDQNDP